MCQSTWTALFFLINTLLVSLLSVFVGILFLQSLRTGAMSLTTGLVARIQCSHLHNLTSISGGELKPHFKPLQAEATQDLKGFVVKILPYPGLSFTPSGEVPPELSKRMSSGFKSSESLPKFSTFILYHFSSVDTTKP